MKKYIFRNKPTDFPECIDELTPEQYIYYIFLSSMLAQGVITADLFAVRWVSFLGGLRGYDFTILREEFVHQAQNLMPKVMRGFLKSDDHGQIPIFETCKNLLPEFEGYKGPADWLNGLPFGKFVQCATLTDQIKPGEDCSEIYKEVARVLYSIPEGKEVPPVLAWHAPLLFRNVCASIQSGPIDINGRLLDLSIIFKSSGAKRADDRTGWTGVAFEVAAAGVFGNVHELETTDFWAVLLYLYKCKFEYNHDKNKAKP